MTGLKLARLALSCLALKYKQEEQLNHQMCRVTFSVEDKGQYENEKNRRKYF